MRLDETRDQYMIDLGLEQDAADNTLNLTLNLNFPRTPLRKLSSNATTTPHRAATVGKTPGTIRFATELQAIRDAYPKITTPTFSSQVNENWDSSPVLSQISMTPLVQKSCPPKQINKRISEGKGQECLKKSLFGGKTRKSMGGVLRMRFDDD
jgi:hypothetical protein